MPNIFLDLNSSMPFRCPKYAQLNFFESNKNILYMPEKYTLKFNYELKNFFEEYLYAHKELGFDDVAKYLRSHLVSLKNDLEKGLYSLKLNKEIIKFINEYVKNNPNFGYINGDELIRDLIRKKIEDIKSGNGR